MNGSGTYITSVTPNQTIADELHKTIIGELRKFKVQSSFMDNKWDIDFGNIQLISRYNKQIHFLCVIDVFRKSKR